MVMVSCDLRLDFATWPPVMPAVLFRPVVARMGTLTAIAPTVSALSSPPLPPASAREGEASPRARSRAPERRCRQIKVQGAGHEGHAGGMLRGAAGSAGGAVQLDAAGPLDVGRGDRLALGHRAARSPPEPMESTVPAVTCFALKEPAEMLLVALILSPAMRPPTLMRPGVGGSLRAYRFPWARSPLRLKLEIVDRE